MPPPADLVTGTLPCTLYSYPPPAHIRRCWHIYAWTLLSRCIPMADLLVLLLRFKRLMNKGPITLSSVLFME